MLGPNYVINTNLNALTPDGLLQLWQNAFGVGNTYPDTAAFILEPTDLLAQGLLAGYTLADLTLDMNSAQSVVGSFQVTMPNNTGTPVATWSVSLTPSPNTNPVGFALINQANGILYFLSAFPSSISTISGSTTWVGQVPLGSCQG